MLKYRMLAVLASVLCCAMGVLAAIAADPSATLMQSVIGGIAISLAPSLIAGFLIARQLGYRDQVQAADLDSLTGLFGETRLEEALSAEWSRCRRLGKLVAVVIADLNQDGRFGVPEYVAWRAMARTLKSVVREYDSAYVLSPGRFAVLLSATTEDGGPAVIARLRGAIRNVPELYGVQVRFGQSAFNPSSEEPLLPVSLLNRAIAEAEQSSAESVDPAGPAANETN